MDILLTVNKSYNNVIVLGQIILAKYNTEDLTGSIVSVLEQG